jgi:hypothetical protein
LERRGEGLKGKKASATLGLSVSKAFINTAFN